MKYEILLIVLAISVWVGVVGVHSYALRHDGNDIIHECWMTILALAVSAAAILPVVVINIEEHHALKVVTIALESAIGYGAFVGAILAASSFMNWIAFKKIIRIQFPEVKFEFFH